CLFRQVLFLVNHPPPLRHRRMLRRGVPVPAGAVGEGSDLFFNRTLPYICIFISVKCVLSCCSNEDHHFVAHHVKSSRRGVFCFDLFYHLVCPFMNKSWRPAACSESPS